MPLTTGQFTSIGYPGGVITDDLYAKIQRQWGNGEGIGSPSTDSWKPVPITGVDRTVNILAGSGFGGGIFDTTNVTEVRQMPALTGGATARTDTLVMRRTWSPGNDRSDFVFLPQGTNPTRNAGTVWEQPIARCTLSTASPVPVVVDLRTWASKKVYAPNLAALAALELWPYQEVQINDVTYRMVPAGGGILTAQPIFKPDFVLDQGTWYRQHYAGISLQTIPPNADRAVVQLNNRYGTGVDTPTQYIFNCWFTGLPVPNTASVTNIAIANAAGTALTVNLSGVTAGGTVRFAWTADWIGDI